MLVCPFTFVRTKLLMERMKPGEIATVLLSGGDALENVPRSVNERGYEIVELEDQGDNVYKFVMRKPPDEQTSCELVDWR